MPRPFCKKTINDFSKYEVFKPNAIPLTELEEIILSLDELEALRLSDLEGLYQEAAARAMGISRQTFGRIIESARQKTANAILNGKALRVTGGNVRLKNEGEDIMKIAIPTVGDQVDQHFGHCEKYSVVTIEDKAIKTIEYMESPAGCGCKSNMASVLAQSGVKILIAGGIGNGAVNVLASNGIKTIKGASGSVRNAVELYLQGNLLYSGDICLSHSHDPNHVCQH
jgi:predicted DNA-binding protein (UPF0251 family)/predicted Fe-Mo cluster-binding NifX family protein